MREILFRGRRVDNGEWVEGIFYQHPLTKECFVGVHDYNNYSIAYMGNLGCPVFNKVDPTTVGQYTGLKDKNGKWIFEGDILSFPDTGEDGYEYKEGYDFTNVATVCWNNGRWELGDYGDYNSGVMEDMDVSHCDFVATFPESEVIGNIHDTPELPEKEDDHA